MENYQSRRWHFRHYSLEIFGFFCGIHEALMFYPDAKLLLDSIPKFESIFSITMGFLFVVTVLLWVGAWVGMAWGYFRTAQPPSVVPPISSIPPPNSKQGRKSA
jgi:hypothetical protein